MADSKDTAVQEAEDTSVSEAEDTSTAEDTQETDGQELEDIEVSEDELEPDETDEAEESTDDSGEDSEDETEEVDEDTEAEEEDTTPSDDKQQTAKEAFAKREAQRQVDKTKAQQKYLEEAEDDKDLALRQLQIDAYNNRIEGNNNKLQNGIDRAVAAINLFREGSAEAKEELSNSLDDFERMYVKRDQNGDPIEVTGDVYQYLQSKANSIQRLTGVGARQQTKNKANEKSRTFTPPAKTPKQSKEDEDLKAFDEEASRY